MGSDESSSRFEVTKSKSRKHDSKKHKPKDTENKLDFDKVRLNNDVRLDRENMVQKGQKGKKRKVNNITTSSSKNLKRRKGKQEGVIKSEDSEQAENDVTSFRKHEESSISRVNSNGTYQGGNETDNDSSKVSKTTSKRQQKRENIEKRENQKREANRLEATQKALNYVSKWKHARSEWKFEKLRQIWLMDNLLDDNSIPDDIFPTVLEYFEGCKGMAREQLLKTGMNIIRKAEEDEENRDEIVESIAYKRARQLLQALPIET